MNLVNEIKIGFANIQNNKALKIETLPEEFPAWILRKNDRFGVGIVIDMNTVISEKFNNVRIKTEEYDIDGDKMYMITLTSNIVELRNEFASVAAQFVDPGINGSDRNHLRSNPRDWLEKWTTLLGNTIRNRQPYQLLGELVALSYFLKKSKDPKWNGYKGQTHDIGYLGGSCEVKSTIQRYGELIEVNSQYQLDDQASEFSLCFVRFEPTINGLSINKLVDLLAELGYSRTELESGLENLGYESGSGSREVSYTLLGAKLYPVNQQFPKISRESFVGKEIPKGIYKITYTVDLENLESVDILSELK